MVEGANVRTIIIKQLEIRYVHAWTDFFYMYLFAGIMDQAANNIIMLTSSRAVAKIISKTSPYMLTIIFIFQ